MKPLSSHQSRLLRECCHYAISDVGGQYYRLGGYGCVSIRFNRRSLYALEERGLVRRDGYWKATEEGRKLISSIDAKSSS